MQGFDTVGRTPGPHLRLGSPPEPDALSMGLRHWYGFWDASSAQPACSRCRRHLRAGVRVPRAISLEDAHYVGRGWTPRTRAAAAISYLLGEGFRGATPPPQPQRHGSLAEPHQPSRGSRVDEPSGSVRDRGWVICAGSLAGRRSDCVACSPGCRRQASRVRAVLSGRGAGPYVALEQLTGRRRKRAKAAESANPDASEGPPGSFSGGPSSVCVLCAPTTSTTTGVGETCEIANGLAKT